VAKPATSVALLWGEDDYLLREAALQIAGDRRVTEVDAAEWQGSELQDLATPSLFGEPRARSSPRTSLRPIPTRPSCCAAPSPNEASRPPRS
jgi:hypothetical protein